MRKRIKTSAFLTNAPEPDRTRASTKISFAVSLESKCIIITYLCLHFRFKRFLDFGDLFGCIYKNLNSFYALE